MSEQENRMQRIIEYLSGELSVDESKAFELEMKRDESLRHEVDQLRKTRFLLEDWKDQSVTTPSLDAVLHHSGKSTVVKKMVLPGWVKLAAAMMTLPIMAWLLNLQISIDKSSFIISFGSSQLKQTEQYLDQMVQLNNQVHTQLANLSTLSDSISAQQSNKLEIWASDHSKDIENMLKSHQVSHSAKVDKMMNRMEDKNEEELAEMLNTLLATLESQRQEDLGKIEVAFLQIAEALNRQQFETEELLASIIYNSPIKNN